MKFGKEFASQMVPEWKEAYVNYSSLKKWVKQIESSSTQRSRGVPPQSPYRAFSGLLRRKSVLTTSSEGDVENPPIKVRRNDAAEGYETVFLVAEDGGGVDESEVKYFRKLDEEFNKVERFYAGKVEEVITEAEMLNKQMDALIAFRVKVARPCGGGGASSEFDQAAEATGLAADVAVSVAALSSSTPSSARAHNCPLEVSQPLVAVGGGVKMVNVMVERATNELLIGPDWAMNLEICDILNRDSSQAKDVIKGIKKKLASKNPKVQLLTLTLLETLVKNCGDIVHSHVAEKDVLHELVRIVKKKPDIHVKEKILILIDTWQEAFGGPRARYPQYYAVYQELLRAGAVFPQRSESTAPVFTPPQSQPLPTYPPNVRNSDFLQEAHSEPSSQSQLPTLSAIEIQNARGIMDVFSEMLNALDPGNKEGLRQEVIVDLVEQCRTYKQRAVNLVSSTDDETLMCQGLAMSDDLDRLLEKHEAIASGAPIRVDQPKAEPAQKPIPADNPLIDTGDSSKHADKTPALFANAGARAEPPLLALPAPTTTTSSLPPVKLDPKIDLLSGDDYNSPTANGNLALVPVGEAQPVSPLSQQNALVLIDFHSESSMTTSSGAQPCYLSGKTQMPTPSVNQQQNHSSSEPVLYANWSSQNQQQNSHMSHPALYANGGALNQGVSRYEQSSYNQSGTPPWNGQQQPPSTVYGSEMESSFPPPPWEAQPVESDSQTTAQYPEFQETVPYGQQNGMYPVVSIPVTREQMGNGMYMQSASQPFQSNQYVGMQSQHMGVVPQQMLLGQIYPHQMFGYQMQGYGYSDGYGQQQDPRLLQQKMIGLSITGNNGGMMHSSYPTASAASYSSAVKPKGPEDKLFGDLVDISKFKSAKSTAG